MLDKLEVKKDFIIYVPEYRFVYCFIPKVACTSIKMWIQQILGRPSGINPHLDPAIIDLQLSRCNDDEAMKILNDDSVFRFSFVRNPWMRLVSAYINKFGSFYEHLAKFTTSKNESQIWRFVDDYHEPFVGKVIAEVCSTEEEIIKGLTFRMFVNYLLATDDWALDPHWRPQYCFLEGLELDFVGKIESMEEDMKIVQNAIGFFGHVSFSNCSNIQEVKGRNCADIPCPEIVAWGGVPSYKQFYDAALIEEVARKYSRDFSYYRYSYD